MKAVIVVFPGTNRERDMAIALERATGRKPAMLCHRETALPAGLDLVVLPGGFSYGDYLRCGAMAAQSPIMRDGAGLRRARRPCARRLQRLPDPLRGGAAARRAAAQRDAALPVDGLPHARRARRHALHRRLAAGAVFRAPMAHGDGNYFADDATLDRLEGEGLVAFRYATPDGRGDRGRQPQRRARNIAGILSPNLRVCGLMPHPEDLVDPLMGGTDGLPMFESLAETPGGGVTGLPRSRRAPGCLDAAPRPRRSPGSGHAVWLVTC